MKISKSMQKIINYANDGSLRVNQIGNYYYTVPTASRRSGIVTIKRSIIDKLKRLNLISI